VRRIAPATKTALTNDSGDAAKYVFVRLTRPEGYEDVHPELVLEDANINPAFKAEIVAPSTSLTHAARAQSRIDQFIFKWICSEYEFNTDDFKQAKRDFLEAAYAEGRADQREELAALHRDIMNLPVGTPGWAGNDLALYKEGHRDARHAAAELVTAALSSSAAPAREEAGEDARGVGAPSDAAQPQRNGGANA
jgi:hypothetical protein